MTATGESATARPSVGVVIPVLNPGDALDELVGRLEAQQPLPPDRIVVVDSGSADGAPARVAARHPLVMLTSLRPFSHGGSRNHGARLCGTDLVVFLTQDACPADDHWLAALLAPLLADPTIGAAYGRQLPRPGARPTERFFLHHRFPVHSAVRRHRPGDAPPDYETCIFSNVGSVVRRRLLEECPFDESLPMSEDLRLARDLLTAGHGLAYAAEARIVHSHRYSLAGLFRRYRDSVVAIRLIFGSGGRHGRAALARRYLRAEIPYLLRHHPAYLPRYALELLVKVTAGLAAGRHRPG